MLIVKKSALLPLLFFLPTSIFAHQESYQSVEVRDKVRQAFWLIEPDQIKGVVILFAGGGGSIKISKKGIKKKGNFLVRSRELFASQGFVTAVIDKPSDRSAMHYFRTSEQHARDIKVIIQALRQKYPDKPLWLIGTSRGTLSAANAASRLNGNDGPDGIVLTATVTQTSNSGDDSVNDVQLQNIRVPVLIVHHKEDACYVTPYQSAKQLPGKLTSTPVKAFIEFSGGNNNGEPCKAKGYHGFAGIEADVINSIAGWITQH